MPQRTDTAGARASANRRVAVIDIGSNSIRLVVFERLSRAPIALFNEKVMCGLGRGLETSGRLNGEGVTLAIANLARFVRLAEAMDAGLIAMLATAAVRDAENGLEFVAEVEHLSGRAVEVLPGEVEAKLSAQGVIMGVPDAHGFMGDLGGGSLELVALDGEGGIGAHVTLPLGPLRLIESSGGDRDKIRERIDGELDRLAWLKEMRGLTFYPVGGSWRTLARVHMDQTGYPLHVIQHYEASRRTLEDLSRLISGMGRRSLARLEGVARRRLDSLPYAALVLERVLRAARPEQVVFSAYGLREGYVYSRLSAEERRKDPLIVAADELARSEGRSGAPGALLMAWVAALFPEESPAERRLRLVACEISDIGWRDHPDYRAEQAMLHVLRMPLDAIDHRGRCFLAAVLFLRYGGSPEDPSLAIIRRLLDADALRSATHLGLALRLAYSLSAASPKILSESRLALTRSTAILELPARWRALYAEVVERRLDALARSLGRTPALQST